MSEEQIAVVVSGSPRPHAMLAEELTDAGFEVVGQPPVEYQALPRLGEAVVTVIGDPGEEGLGRLVSAVERVATRIWESWHPPGGVVIPIVRRRGEGLADVLVEVRAPAD